MADYPGEVKTVLKVQLYAGKELVAESEDSTFWRYAFSKIVDEYDSSVKSAERHSDLMQIIDSLQSKAERLSQLREELGEAADEVFDE